MSNEESIIHITAEMNTKSQRNKSTKNSDRQGKIPQVDVHSSARMYQMLYKNAPVGIWVTNIKGEILTNNQAMENILGFAPGELKRVNVIDFYFNKNDRKKFIEAVQNSGSVRDFETRFIKKDSTEIVVLINSDCIDLDGQEVFLVSIRDISGIKNIEGELKRERNFVSTILETAASLVIVLNKEGHIVRFNHACEQVSGYTFREVEGKPLFDMFSGNQETIKSDLLNNFSGIGPSSHESYWITKNGEKRLISWTSNVLTSAESDVEFIISTGEDITQRRVGEIKLKEANEKLERWVKALEERTWEMNLLSEMGEHLQSCQNVEEVCAISAQYIRKIFSRSQGAIYLIRPSKDLAEAVQIWSDKPNTKKIFLPTNCWAIRRSRLHIVDNEHPGLLCGHITNAEEGARYICVPMMAQGETMGILHLNHTIRDLGDEDSALNLEHKSQLAVNIADHIALALSNIKLRDTLRQQSIRDILTGLFNRRYMEETLARELHRAERERTPVGIIMFDIDHFKEYNDLAGHDGGDSMLRELGEFLIRSTRGGDIVCRYGGEEFVIVLPGSDFHNTQVRAEELRKGVKELLVYHLGKPLARCTISLGVCAYPEHGTTSEGLIKCVDDALYRAKNEGRDRVVAACVY